MPIGKEYIPFGPYVLVERLASGGMGEVFLARVRDDSGRTVVIKRMRASASSNPTARARFIDESRIATLMEHPNIVRVLDVGMHEGSSYMAMEWLLGWELREILEAAHRAGASLPLPMVATIICEAARGLAAAHAFQTPDGSTANLVHRDISPRNLFVTADGTTKILDFGLATSVLHRRRTEARIVLGTYGYIAPEQINGEGADQRSDIFSLGAVFHELITGEPLIARALQIDAMLESMLSAPLPPPLRSSEEVDGALVSVVMRMLQRNRDARYASAAQVVRDLEAWLGRAGEPSHASIADTVRGLFRATSTAAPAQPHVALSQWGDGAKGELDTEPETPVSMQRRLPRAVVGVAGVIAIAVVGWGAAGVVGRMRVESREPTSDDRNPRADVREPRADVREPRADIREPRSEIREPKSDVREPKSEIREPRAESREPSSDLRAPPAVDSPHPGRLPRHAAKAPPAKPAEPVPAKADTKAPGRLTLDVRPWANVYLGSTFLGATPLVEVALPAGPTRLRLVDPVTGAEQSVMVDVPEGGDVRRVVKRD